MMELNHSTGWGKSHFTLLKAIKTKLNVAKKSVIYQIKDHIWEFAY